MHQLPNILRHETLHVLGQFLCP